MKSDKLVAVVFLIGYAYNVVCEKLEKLRDRVENYVIRKITARMIRNCEGYRVIDEVFNAYAEYYKRNDMDITQIQDQLVNQVSSANLRFLLKTATKKD